MNESHLILVWILNGKLNAIVICYVINKFLLLKTHTHTGLSIERLCEILANEPLEPDDTLCDRTAMVRAARSLLNSVTRVLLLADIVVVKQLLLNKDKVCAHIGSHVVHNGAQLNLTFYHAREIWVLFCLTLTLQNTFCSIPIFYH